MRLGVSDPFMLAPTGGARFLGGVAFLGLLVLLEHLVLLELLAQPRSPSHLVASEKGSMTPSEKGSATL